MATVTAAGAIYTCPMHPQIQQKGPGSCPLCGMALEPMLVVASDEPNAELVDMTRRLRIGLALAQKIVDKMFVFDDVLKLDNFC